MKKFIFISFFILFVQSAFCDEVPPLETKDPAITEDFRQIYYLMDQQGNLFIQNSTSPTTSTQFIRASSGTNSNPGYGWIGDPDTGLRHHVSNDGSWYAVSNGIERQQWTATDLSFFDSSSNVSWNQTSAGEITQPLQPSFLVQNSGGMANFTGDGTQATVTFNSEIFDQGGDIVNSTFTAPVTGKYLFAASVLVSNTLVGHADRAIVISVSNQNCSANSSYILAEARIALSLSCVVDMDAGDIAYVVILIAGSTKTVDIDNSPTNNFFSGSLLN